MLAPQSGQTKLRIAEIKLEFGFVTTATEAIMCLLWGRRFYRRRQRISSAGPMARFGGCPLEQGRGPALPVQA